MRKIILLIFLMPLCPGLFIVHPAQAEVYKYTDKDGVESYTDSIQAVPDKYRKKAVEVKGLREKDEDAKTSGPESTDKQPPAQETSRIATAKMKVRETAEGFIERGYWKPAAALTGFLILFFIIGKLSRSLGGGPVWTIIKVVLVLGSIIVLFYIYSAYLPDTYGYLRERAAGLAKKAESISDNVKKSSDEIVPEQKK